MSILSKVNANKWNVGLGVGAILGLLVAGYEVWPHNSNPSAPTTGFFGGTTPVSTETAISHKDSGTQTVDFTVASLKEFDASSAGTVQALLNDATDFRQSTMTIVLKKSAGLPTPPIGSKLQVTGSVTMYTNKFTKKDGPEIVVSSKDQLKIVN